MPLVTVQRSPSANSSLQQSFDESVGSGEIGGDEVDTNRNFKSLSECYFAGKGTALVLPAEAQKSSSKHAETQGSNIQRHLQSMFYLLRPEETLKMAVKLESVHSGRTRYLVVVSRMGRRAEESCLLGIDCNERTTVGLVLRVLADTAITLDGDGGFSVAVCGRHHIFKPVSVQAMWSALQTLHRASSKARDENYFQGGLSHDWVDYYERRIESDRSCLNEWHAMDDLESRRPPSPDSIRTKPCQREETEKIIRSTLKEIMMSVDLDEVTSKYIRTRLEEEFDMDLGEFKSFIDQEMLTILGQMDAPTEIFDHVYLGSEWNASNYEELKRNGVRHILNVTREIDNFFPGTFDYLNIRVYDDENTDLLKYWDNTYKYITKAKKEGSKVLVHCKMGVSRSASVVIAYAMKAYNWDFETAMRHVKDKRSCIKPNTSFVAQLETYQGILDAMKNKEKLQRSKSETNLKSPDEKSSVERLLPGSQPTPLLQAFSLSAATLENGTRREHHLTGCDLSKMGMRPKSWSPENAASTCPASTVTPFRSLESLNDKISSITTPVPPVRKHRKSVAAMSTSKQRNVLLPCDNGESYSVSPNQIRHLPGQLGGGSDNVMTNVKQIVDEFESQKQHTITTTTQQQQRKRSLFCAENMNEADVSSTNEAWDPGETKVLDCVESNSNNNNNVDDGKSNSCDFINNDDDSDDRQTIWTSSTVVLQSSETVVGSGASFSNSNNSVIRSQVPCTTQATPPMPDCHQTTNDDRKMPSRIKDGDLFSSQLDRVFDREEKKQQRLSTVGPLPVTDLTTAETMTNGDEISRECPSRQSSWGSYDSAVVLAYQGEMREVPSRHSSWGSGDNRTLPSRNSSWGSYDTNPARSVHYKNESGEKVLHSSSTCEDSISYFSSLRRKRHESSEDETTMKESSDCIVDTQRQLSSSTACDYDDHLLTEESSCEDDIIEARNNVIFTKEESSASSSLSSGINITAGSRRSKFRASSGSNSQLSVSAPENSSMEMVPRECSLSRSASNVSSPNANSRYAAIKRNKTFSSHHSMMSGNFRSHNQQHQVSNIVGIVQNLKKEFEALEHRESGDHRVSPTQGIRLEEETASLKSEPASPVANGLESGNEDLSFKKLIVKFENGTRENRDSVILRPPKYFNNALAKNLRHNNRNNRFSSVDMTTSEKGSIVESTPLISSYNNHAKSSVGGKNGVDGQQQQQCKRPPVVPVVKGPASNVVATVIAKAALKQQQYGKSHPLARIHIKPRHNNPVYNTM